MRIALPVAGIVLAAALAMAGCALQPLPTGPAAAADPAELQREPQQLIVLAVADTPEPLGLRAGSTPRGYDLQPGYGAGSRASVALRAIEHDYALQHVGGWPIEPLQLYCVVLRVADTRSRDAVIAQLSADPRVQLAQPLQQFSTLAVSAPDVAHGADPYLSLQRGYAGSGLAEVQRYARGRGVRIGLVDTGVDRHHPDLGDRVVAARNYVDEDWSRFDSDRHGTEVAGIIAAGLGNGVGIAGVAPEAQLHVYKACWQTRPDSDAASCNSFTLAQALIGAAREDVQLLNLSLGGPADPLLERLLRYCQSRGMLVIAAMPASGHGFPVDVPGVIAVQRAGLASADAAALRAPGDEVLTATPGGRYDFVSGSSFAAGFVTGTAALLMGAPVDAAASEVPALLAAAVAGKGADAQLDSCRAVARRIRGLSCPAS